MPPAGNLRLCSHVCHGPPTGSNRHVAIRGIHIYPVDGKSIKTHLATHGECTCGRSEPLTKLQYLRFAYRLFLGYSTSGKNGPKIKQRYEEGWKEYFGSSSTPRYHTIGDKTYPYDLSEIALLTQLAPVPWVVKPTTELEGNLGTPADLLNALPTATLGSTVSGSVPASPEHPNPTPQPLVQTDSDMVDDPSPPYNPLPTSSRPESIAGPPAQQGNLFLPGSLRRDVPMTPTERLVQDLKAPRFKYTLTSGFSGLQGQDLDFGEGLQPIHEYARKYEGIIRNRVVLILSPVWARRPNDDRPKASYSEQVLPQDFVQRIQEKERQCLPWKWLQAVTPTEGEDDNRYIVNDWLYIASLFATDKEKWELKAIWSPRDLVALVTQGHRDQQRLLKEINNCEFVFGGPFWNGDVLREMDDPKWRMTGTQLRWLRVFLDRLPASGVTVWPSPADLLANGMKVFQYRQIWLAAMALGKECPALSVIRSRQELLGLVQSYQTQTVPWACIKREHSKEGNHAFFPETPYKQPPGDEMARLHEHLRQEDQYFRSKDAQDFGMRPPRWFVQPYIPQLRFLGEIRVICINGIISARQYTTPINMAENGPQVVDQGFMTYTDVQVPDSSYIEYDHRTLPKMWLADSDHDPTRLTPQFDMWVLRTLEKLITVEELESGVGSSLSIFVRLDVSVYYNERLRVHEWFVNEVTRSHDTCLWLQVLKDHNRLDALNDIVNRLNEAFYHAASTCQLCKAP